MTVTPNEIATMRRPIEAAFGHVLTFGLGLGYYAYMVSAMPQVEFVTIVEINPQVISLFRQYLLPKFPQRQKIHIVQADAFAYAKSHLASGQFDYVFTDLWHDASDGVPLYLQMKQLEHLAPDVTYSYWIEDTIQYYLSDDSERC